MIRVAIDTETTGLGARDPNGPRPDGVCQVGIAWRHDDGKLFSAKFECDPGEEFYKDGRADAAFKVNGYSVEKLKTLPPASKVAEELIMVLNEIGRSKDVRLGAYNRPFDQSFLDGDPWFIDSGGQWADDLMERAAKAAGIPVGENGHRFTLKAAMQFAQIERTGTAHDAESDAVDALKLWEWLDARDTQQEMQHVATPLDVVAGINARLNAALVDAGFPSDHADTEKVGTVSPSDLWMRPQAYWDRYHGTPRAVDPFFEEIKRPLSAAVERLELDRFQNAGLWVIRGEYVSDGLFAGKLDGRVEWPRGSGQWIVVEVKSKWDGKTLQTSLTYPQPAWLDQIECYMRITGIRAALLDVFIVGDPSKPETWQRGLRLFTPDDTRWARIVTKAKLFLELQKPETPRPA